MRAVVELRRAGPYALDQFKRLLDGQQTHGTQAGIPGDAVHLAGRASNFTGLSLADHGEYPPRYSERIADRCKQIGEFRRTLGVLPEPFWYACVSVLGFAENGEHFAHEWSKGDKRYTAEETNKKLARARQLSGPRTCQWFEDHNPEGCKNCEWKGKITTPLQLGETDNKLTPQVNGERTLPDLPKGYGWDAGKLVARQGKLQGGTTDTLISQQSIYISDVNKGEVAGDFSLTFQHKIKSEGWNAITLRMKDLFAPNGLGELNDRGVVIHEPDLFKKYVKVMVDQHYDKTAVSDRYDQYGFKKEGFLYGKHLYTPEGPQEAAISRELTIRNLWIGPGCGSGNDPATGLARWKQAANTLFATGCESQSLAVLASFAAPLMRYVATDEGGAILSLVNRESGTGKTTALAGAASVWGKREGLGLTNDDNRVTKFLTMAALGNLPLVYDQMETKDPTFIQSLVENFTNGRDKMRADRSGQIRHRAATWQTIMICASNSSIVDVLSTSQQTDAALAWRLFELDLSIPEHLKHAIGERLRTELILNAGYAGAVYANYLVQVRDHLPTWIEQALTNARQKTGFANTKYRFWERLLAVISVAGIIVRHLNLLDVSVDRLVLWMINGIKERKEQDGIAKFALMDNWALRELERFVSESKEETLRVSGVWQKNIPIRPINDPRGRISARYETGNKRFTVIREAMKDYAVTRGFPWHAWREELQKSKVMGEVKRITLTAGTELAGAQVWCFELNLAHYLLTDEDEASNVVQLRVVE